MDREEEIKVAKQEFNACWTLIETANRTPEQDQEMIDLAKSSRAHWGVVGTPMQWAIGDWQCSHVYALLGDGINALRYAQQSVENSRDLPKPHFMHASALQALAHAHFLLGDLDKAITCKNEAIDHLVGVPEEDALHIRNQISAMPF